jgi:hypothetical protein
MLDGGAALNQSLLFCTAAVGREENDSHAACAALFATQTNIGSSRVKYTILRRRAMLIATE